MTDEFAPTRLERLQSINRSIGKIDRVSADVLAMWERHRHMQEMADRQLVETTTIQNLLNKKVSNV